MTAFDPSILPPGLPVPADDGAAGHLAGMKLPALSLASTAGQIDLPDAAAGTLVLYIYPRTSPLDLPTFEIAGMPLYRRITLIACAGWIEHVFYPVFPPDRNAADVAAWLRAEHHGGRPHAGPAPVVSPVSPARPGPP